MNDETYSKIKALIDVEITSLTNQWSLEKRTLLRQIEELKNYSNVSMVRSMANEISNLTTELNILKKKSNRTLDFGAKEKAEPVTGKTEKVAVKVVRKIEETLQNVNENNTKPEETQKTEDRQNREPSTEVLDRKEEERSIVQEVQEMQEMQEVQEVQEMQEVQEVQTPREDVTVTEDMEQTPMDQTQYENHEEDQRKLQEGNYEDTQEEKHNESQSNQEETHNETQRNQEDSQCNQEGTQNENQSNREESGDNEEGLVSLALDSGNYFWERETGDLYEMLSETECGECINKLKSVSIKGGIYYIDGIDFSIYLCEPETCDVGARVGYIKDKRAVFI